MSKSKNKTKLESMILETFFFFFLCFISRISGKSLAHRAGYLKKKNSLINLEMESVCGSVLKKDVFEKCRDGPIHPALFLRRETRENVRSIRTRLSAGKEIKPEAR